MDAESLSALPRPTLKNIAENKQARKSTKTKATTTEQLDHVPDGVARSPSTQPLPVVSSRVTTKGMSRKRPPRKGPRVSSEDEASGLEMERSMKGMKAKERARKRLSAVVNHPVGESVARTDASTSATVVELDGESCPVQVVKQPEDLSEPNSAREVDPSQVSAPPGWNIALSDALDIEEKLKAGARRVTRAYAEVSNLVSITEDVILKGVYVDMRTGLVLDAIADRYNSFVSEEDTRTSEPAVLKRKRSPEGAKAETTAGDELGGSSPRKRARTSVGLDAAGERDAP
ncbi:hypothetical protein OF83DRAFT_1122970 [Amylostereum chailletii]|nr:hypothetical protein OF83DRAFT_1122970 [Amylostereum chailletii]